MKIVIAALNAKYPHTNLAIRYLRTQCLESRILKKSSKIVLKEYTINDSIQTVVSDLVSEKPDICAFSCYIWNISLVLEIADNLKKIAKDSIVVLGGPEVSFESEELMERNSHIDFIIKGSGEKTFVKLCEEIVGGHKTADFVDNIIEGEKVELSELEFPYKYERLNNTVKRYYYETTRGCPFSCSYCLSSMGNSVVFLEDERIRKELEYFIGSKVMQVKFVDRTFNYDDAGAIRIWRYLIEKYKKENNETNFHFEIVADLLSEDALEMLKSVPEGLFRFEVGIQTTNKNTLAEISRKTDIERAFSNISRVIRETNVDVHLDLIAGLPLEDMESFKKSFNDVMGLRPDVVQLGFLKLLKGSKLRHTAHKYGIEFSASAPYEVLVTDCLEYKEITELKKISFAVDKYYNSGQFRYSLDFILKYFPLDPFSFFDLIAKNALDNNTYYKISRKQLIIDLSIVGEKIINEKHSYFDPGEGIYFFESTKTLSKESAIKVFKDLLKFDYYRYDRKGNIKGLSFNSGRHHPELPLDKEKSGWFDKGGGWIYKRPKVEKYSFDAKKLQEQGVLSLRDTFVLYETVNNKPEIKDYLYLNRN